MLKCSLRHFNCHCSYQYRGVNDKEYAIPTYLQLITCENYLYVSKKVAFMFKESK